MSSDNAQSAVTYTSISFYSDGPSWGIPLMNVGEFMEIDPYEEVAQQGQAHPLSPAYVQDPMELDEHVPVYVPELEHPKYHAPSDDDIQVKDQPHIDDASPIAESPGYITDSDSMEENDDEDPEEDPEKDPSEEYEPEDDDEDPEEDPNEEHEPEDEDTKEPFEDSNETKPFEEDETALTPPPPSHHGARISAPLGHRTAMIRRRDDILEEDMPPRRRFAFTAPPPGYDLAESSAAAARAPRGQYDFVNTIEAGQGLIRSIGHDARTIARVADRAEDVGYVRALQAFERRMMTSIEEVNLRVSYQAQVRRQEKLALMCTKFLADETEKVKKYISGLPDNIHGNVMSARPKTLDETIELANDLMDQNLRTYAERQNENKRKADDSSRNTQQQPHKKQNVARAYTADPGEKKVYTEDLPLCTKCNYHYTG
nr:hypothetical protein [Tanacetum cinerariifolium]